MPSSTLIARYREIQRKLLPTGVLWKFLDSTFKLFLESFGVEAARIHENKDDLLREAFPGKSTTGLMLSDWENEVLLQDEKPAPSDTQQQRQQRVKAKAHTLYAGPNKQFWIDLAAKFGMTVDVFDNDEIAGSDVARIDEALIDLDRVSEEGNQFSWEIDIIADPQSQSAKFQQLVNRLKPAHTTVTFT